MSGDGPPDSPSKTYLGPPPRGLAAGCGSNNKPSSSTAPGKIQYDRNFLLQFQPEFTTPPESLKDFHKNFHVPGQTGQKDVPPTSTLNRKIERPEQHNDHRKSGRGGRGGGGGRRQPQPPQFGSMQQDAYLPGNTPQKLERGENAYDVRKVWNSSMDDRTRLVKQMKGVLNRLAPEKYDSLVGQMKNPSVLNDDETMKEIIHLVFEKAIQEPRYAEMYANLCHDLSKAELQVKDTNDKKLSTFRRLLLERCQMEFEHREREITRPEGSEKWTAEELNEWETKNRDRKTGNIRFVGELFKHSMLTEKIMKIVMCNLLFAENGPPTGPVTYRPPEEDIAILSKLLATIGSHVDKQGRAQVWVDQCFDRISALCHGQEEYPSRFKFMLLDTLELRESNWVPRKVEVKVSKIQDMDKNIEEAAIMKARKAEEAARQKEQKAREEKDRQSRQKSKRGGGSDDWTTVGNTKQIQTPTKQTQQQSHSTPTPKKGAPGSSPPPSGKNNRDTSSSTSNNTTNTTSTTSNTMAAATTDGEKKKKKKDKDSTVDRTLPIPSPADLPSLRGKVLSFVSEWELAEQHSSSDLSDIMDDINGWEDDAICSNKPTLHAFVVTVIGEHCCQSTSEKRRNACVELLEALEKQGQESGDEWLKLAAVERGLAHVLSEALQNDCRSDCPLYLDRYSKALLHLLPMPFGFNVHTKIFFLAYNSLAAVPDLTAEDRNEMGQEFCEHVWQKVMANCGETEQFQEKGVKLAILDQLHAFAVKTGWPNELVHSMFSFVISKNIIPAALVQEWKDSKVQGGDKKAKQYQQTAEIVGKALQ